MIPRRIVSPSALGLGAVQIKRGLEGMNAFGPDADGDTILLGIIWGITAIATISVVSGVHVGIKILSQLAFSLGLFILVIVFFAGSTEFYLNNMSSSVGYYFHYAFTKLGWHTDAYAQLGFGEGAAPDMLGASKSDQVYGGAPSFMSGWTIFYWGWWIAWAPFVGMFIARISRGRTVREIINYTLTGPLIFCFMWFGVFGGAAIQMENQAQMLWKAGTELYNDPTYFQAGQGLNAPALFAGPYLNAPAPPGKNDAFGSEPWCWKKKSVNISAADFPGYCAPAGSVLSNLNPVGCVPAGFNSAANKATAAANYGAYSSSQGCGACFVQQASLKNATHSGCEIWLANKLSFNPEFKGSCPFWIKTWKANPALSPQCLFTDYDEEASWYNVVGQFYELGPFLQGISIVTLVLYFVTSSDSGSLVVDTISAGGRDEQNPIQRVIWALIEGAVATGLVIGGKYSETMADGTVVTTSAKNVLKALQAASICCGLPFTFLLCFMMPALWYGLQSEDKKNPKNPKYFKTPVYAGVFDVFEWLFSAGQSVPFPEMSVFVNFFIGAVFAPFKLWQILTEMETGKIALTACGSTLINKIMYTFASTFCFISWIAMVFITPSRGLWSVAWALFLAHAIFLAVIRMEVRGQLDLAGDFAQDFFASLVFYPCVLHQIHDELIERNKHIDQTFNHFIES